MLGAQKLPLHPCRVMGHLPPGIERRGGQGPMADKAVVEECLPRVASVTSQIAIFRGCLASSFSSGFGEGKHRSRGGGVLICCLP